MSSTANNNENLTNDESSNQEGSDSQEIVELEWSNIISFVCDLQLFEKSYLLIHVFLKRKCYDELFSIFLRTKCDEKKCYDKSSRFIAELSRAKRAAEHHG